ncbi:hypothetical protein ACO2Q9_18190 [Variovorax sp. VNK109]|jgi:hypothetical protein|uniref:hypothetical protein n=1 Tax=Variovorax sp. VNK109 TaxID=3400919 RepID=UPI003C072271
MAISWLTVLKMVPWSDVIANAPKVADGAKKLWNAASKKSGPAATVAREAALADTGPVDPAALRAQVQTLEAAVAELHGQMQASSELIKELAEQNALLVARIDANRKRMQWVAVIAVAALLLTVAFALSASTA